MTALAPASRDVARVAGVGSPRLRERLAGPLRPATVLHRGADAVYVDADGWALGVVSSRASRVPCALWTAAGADLDLATVTEAEVGDRSVVLHGGRDGDRVLTVARLVDVTVPRLRTPVDPRLVTRLRVLAADAETELADVLTTVPDPALLLGRGSGLTPLGDDVLAGWTATRVAQGGSLLGLDDVRDRTTLFSATLLTAAEHGEVLPEFRGLVAALAVREPVLALDRARALVRVGHTSGSGLLLGAALALEAPR